MKIIYCSSCQKQTKANIVSKEEIFNVKGEDIRNLSSVAVCQECGEEVFDSELDEDNFEQAYNEYRKKHNLLTPSQIKNIREKYGLSQRALSSLLGFGEITIHRYESGAIQDKSHNEILSLIEKPENMRVILEKNIDSLPAHLKDSLRKKIDELLKGEKISEFNQCLENRLVTEKQLNEFVGYTEFDLDKIKNIILYFICSQTNIFKTKLNKLLWYSDFLYFKKYAVSITGNSYIHAPFGPVFNGYELILGAMLLDNLIDKEEINFEENISGELLKPMDKCDICVISKAEKEVIDCVMEHFKNYSCKQISDFSHNEKPYKETKEGEKISYHLAKDLALNI